MAGRLHEVDIPAANVLVDASPVFAVGEVLQLDLAERIAEVVRDFLRQRDIRSATEDLELEVIVHRRVAFAEKMGELNY